MGVRWGRGPDGVSESFTYIEVENTKNNDRNSVRKWNYFEPCATNS